MNKEHKPRPYWHVDLKWISGITAAFALGIGLLLLALAGLTSPARGPEISAAIVASLFSPDGLDAPIDTTDLQRKLAASPNGKIAPLEGFPAATITAADLKLSPKELRMRMFRQISEPIYTLGVEGAAKQFTADPEAQKKFSDQAFALKFLTRDMHERLKGLGLAALALGVVELLSVAWFSARWGRLANPGLLLAFVAFPGTIAGLTMLPTMATQNSGGGGPVPPAVMLYAAAALQEVYPMVLWLGVGMLVVAGIGRIVTAVRHKAEPAAH